MCDLCAVNAAVYAQVLLKLRSLYTHCKILVMSCTHKKCFYKISACSAYSEFFPSVQTVVERVTKKIGNIHVSSDTQKGVLFCNWACIYSVKDSVVLHHLEHSLRFLRFGDFG